MSASVLDPRLPAATPERTLVRLCPHGLRQAGRATPHAVPWRFLAAELGIREHANGRVGLLLDFRLARRTPAEAAVRKPSRTFDELDELRLGGTPDRVLLAPLPRRREQCRLDPVERLRDCSHHALDWGGSLPTGPTCQHHLPAREIAGADLQPHWDAEAFPFEVFRTWLHRVP